MLIVMNSHLPMKLSRIPTVHLGLAWILSVLSLTLACVTIHAALPVTTTNDSGPGSLRQAITDANANINLDTIVFAITNPPSGVRTIRLATNLPVIAKPVIIDGYTQPGSSSNTLANGNNAVLLIELSGGGANYDGLGFNSGGTNCIVRGLII